MGDLGNQPLGIDGTCPALRARGKEASKDANTWHNTLMVLKSCYYPPAMLAAADELVRHGVYVSTSDCFRDALRELLNRLLPSWTGG